MAEPNTNTVFQGTRNSVNINTDSLVRDVKRGPQLLEADRQLLMVTMDKLGSRVTGNPKFEWQEDEYVAENMKINKSGGYSAVATSLVFDNTLMCIPGDVLRNLRTAEVMLVSANVTGTSTLTVVRAIDETAAGVIINDNDDIIIIGNANQQGATLRDIVTTQMAFPFNRTQIFRTPVGLTRTQANSDTYHGKDMPYQLKKKLSEHSQEKEKTILFGKRGWDVSGTNPRGLSGGMQQIISTNLTSQVSLTELEWGAWLRGILRWASGVRTVVCADIYLSALEFWSKDKLRINDAAKKFGLAIFTYVTPFGRVLLFKSEILTRTPTWETYAFCLNLDAIEMRHIAGANTKLLLNRQANDEDSVKHEYLTEMGLERRFEKSHGLMTGVTAFTA